MRVTDLDKFSYEHVWLPYWSLTPYDTGRRPRCAPCELLETADLLEEDTEWANLVLDRIRGIGVKFPLYVQHKLVDVVKAKTA